MPGNLGQALSTTADPLDVPPPRPPVKVRMLSPELRADIQEKTLAQERAEMTGSGSEEAVIDEARKIEKSRLRPGFARDGRGMRGYAERAAGSGYGRYGRYGGYGGYGGNGPRGVPRAGSGYGAGPRYGGGPRPGSAMPGYRDGALGGHRNPRAGTSSSHGDAGSSGARALYVDVVPWNGRMEQGPCDPAGVFEVRKYLRELAPHLIGSGCEKYAMDADKLLNNLPTDFASDGIPACRNDYLVKSTAKMVYNTESCAAAAMARAEHVNEDEDYEVNQILGHLQSSRLSVLLPVNGYSSPATFPGHPHMTEKDWANFDHSDSAGQLAKNWGSAGGLHGGHSLHGGHGWHGHGGGYGPGGRTVHPDVYGQPPRPQKPLQHPGMGIPAPEKDVDPHEQEVRAAVDKAKELAKDPSLIPGPMAKDGSLPTPPTMIMPIFRQPRPMLDNGFPSIGLPVWGPPVEISLMPCSPWSVVLMQHLAPGCRRGHRYHQAVAFFAS